MTVFFLSVIIPFVLGKIWGELVDFDSDFDIT